MDYLDKNNIYKPETITLKFEDYQKLLDEVVTSRQVTDKLKQMVEQKDLVFVRWRKSIYNNLLEMFVPFDKIKEIEKDWETINLKL